MIEVGKPHVLIFKFSDRKKIAERYYEWTIQHDVLNCAESFLAWLWQNGYLNVDRITDDLKHGERRKRMSEFNMTEFNDKLAEALQALRDETYTTWLGDFSPYTCEKCGFHVDSKTRYCPECGRRAVNYD